MRPQSPSPKGPSSMAESKWNPDRARKLLQELGLTRREPNTQVATPSPVVEPRATNAQVATPSPVVEPHTPNTQVTTPSSAVEPRVIPNHQERVMNTPAASPRFPSSHAENRSTSTQQKPVTSVLGPSLRFKGELQADEDLLIQGQLEGSIEHTRSLTIGTE